MMTDTPENVTLVPIARIEVLNSRDRNMKVFEEIVESIQLIGLKKPITVAERAGEDGQLKYVLVCGEGRLNAFRILGETHIPALVVDVSDEDAFIMSLAENIARRGYRPLEILADIELLRERGYTADVIIQKTGLGMETAPCLMAKDDETFSYNHRINRLSTVQEHYMLRRAIDRGVSRERLARAFNVNLSSINRRINLLEGICPEAIDLLQDKQFTPDVTRILRNMKAARQVEAVELMVASNTITVAHAEALLKATPPEQRADLKPAERDKTSPIEQIVKLEKEMSQVHTQYKDAEQNYGSDLLNLVVAKGYLTKLLANDAVKSYIQRHEPEILEQFELVVNTVSMEEAVQQQAETSPADVSEASEP